jgi:hypothetical protein
VKLLIEDNKTVLKGSQKVTQIKHLGAGVYREWIADGRVCVMLATQTGREVTDVWTDAVKKLIDQADPAKPLYLIYDYSASRTNLTAYNQQKILEVAAYRPEIINIMAVIVQKNLFGQIIKAFVEHLNLSHIIVKVFFSRGDGETWIMDMMKKEDAKAQATANTSLTSDT